MNKACKFMLPPWKGTVVLQDCRKEGKCAVCSGLLQEAKREGNAGQGDSFLSGSPRAFWRLKAAEFPGRSPEAMNASQEWEGDSARGSRFGASAMRRFGDSVLRPLAAFAGPGSDLVQDASLMKQVKDVGRNHQALGLVG